MTRIFPINNFRNYLLKLLLFCFFSFLISSLSAQTNTTIEADYQNAIKKGDQYLSEEKHDKALYYFESASRLKPDEKYPKTKISVIKDLLDDQKTKNILFEVSITSGERWFKASEFKKAKAEYESALKINPTAQYPKDRLAQISKLWSDPEVDAAYAKAIMKADDLFSRKSYQGAKAEYMTASDLKRHEQYPLDRILEINDILASSQALQQAYDELISRGDDQFDQSEYESARDNYSKALGLKPDEIYPKNRIGEIERILGDLLTQREEYDKIIALADDYYINNDFEKAKIEYRKAASTIPGERYPGNMISKLDPMIEEQQGIQRKYDLAISNADKYLQAENYENAITSLQNAGDIKPEESYPNDKITEINGILAQIEAERLRQEQLLAEEQQRQEQLAMEEQQRQEQLALEEQKRQKQLLLEEQQRQEQLRIDQEKQQQAYDDAIAAADKAFGDEDYQTALTSYSTAGEIKPEESYPNDKITEISGILAHLEAERLRQEQLLAEEQQRQEQLALEEQQRKEQLALEEQKQQEQLILEEQQRLDQLRIDQEKQQQTYDDAIAAADKAFGNEEYQAALTSYSTAGEIKPEENYPNDKITEINGILAQLEAERLRQEQLLAEEQQRQEQLALEEQQRLEQLALEEQQRQEQLALEKQKQQEQLALEEQKQQEQLLLVEQQRQEQLTLKKQQQKAYDNAIKEADRLFLERSYETAKPKYQLALGIKPEEIYPRTRIRKIEELLAQKASAQRDYNDAITQGDEYFSEKKYQQSTSSFEEALTLFPDEPYPKNKINEIKSIIEGLKIQKEYNDAIAKADLFFEQENYEDAIKNYQDAFNIKPDEKYPINRIDEINVAIQGNEVAKEKAYNNAIARADKYYSEEDYKNAKNQYLAAIKIYPDESYPRERLKDVEKLLLAREMELAEAYQKAIAKADNLYNKKILDQAIQAYRDAKKIKPDETYPDNRINSIRIFIEEHAIVDLVASSVIIKNNSDEKYNFPPINIRFRKNNYILLKARIIGEDNAKVYLSYGQDAQKYGGIVLKNIQRGEINDYIIRISSQDPWYRNDNNWLSIYSEGGDIEVTSLQISQGD